MTAEGGLALLRLYEDSSIAKLMKAQQTQYIGIDISKDHFDVCLGGREKRFSQDREGAAALLAWLGPKKARAGMRAVMESTGPYWMKLARALHEAGVAVSVLNPLFAKNFFRSRGRRAKSDRIDAALLAEYGRANDPERWMPPSEAEDRLRQLHGTREMFVAQRTRVSNRMKALDREPCPCPVARRALAEERDALRGRIKALDAEADRLAKLAWEEPYRLLQTLHGVGPVTARALLVATRGFTRFESAGQLASYAGLCPQKAQSGQWQGRAGIVKLGGGGLRRLLYQGALSAKEKDGYKLLYDRLMAKGRSHKQAMVAVAHKMLRHAFAVVKKGVPYRYEAPVPENCAAISAPQA
jgi:transposase